MSNFLKNNSARLSFRALIVGLILAIAFGAVGWLSVSERHKARIIGRNGLDIQIPIEYTEPLIIAAFNNIFSIKPIHANNSQAITQGENIIKYIDAYSNTDVVQTKYSDKIKEDIILKMAGHPKEFKYQINLEDYDYKWDNGSLHFYVKGKKGELNRLFTIPEPYMIEQGNLDDKGEVEMRIEGNYLVLVPDVEWIKNHTYPIIVDPTIEINILNLHSNPAPGEEWVVEFTTLGKADLTITPADRATIDDDEFMGLYCNGKKKNPQILENDVIYYKDWSCDGQAKVIHYTRKAGHHHLIFDFGGQIAHAYNDPEPWWNTDYTYRQKLVFDNTDQSNGHEDFPVVATSTDSDFWSHVQDDYRDLRFVNDDGDELYFEVEEFNYSGDDMTTWVRLNYAHATITDSVWMYYGNSGAATSTYASSTAVWDEDYAAVFHLQDSSDTSHTDDSTRYDRGATKGAAGEPTEIAGKISYGEDYDGGDYLSFAQIDFGTDDFSIMTWFKTSQSADVGSMMQNYTGSEFMGMTIYSSKTNCYYRKNGGSEEYFASDANTNNNAWHLAHCQREGDNMYMYVDGDQQAASDTGHDNSDFDSGGSWYLGVQGTGSNRYYTGVLDEVRISTDARSEDWIAFEYCNMTGICNTYTAEESAPAIALDSVVDTPDPTNPGRSVSFIIDWENGSSVKAKICKTDSLTNQNCDDGYWASSTNFMIDDPVSVKYNVVGGDAGQTRDYYAFVCDSVGSCSDSSSGTFSVNTISTVPNIDVRGGATIR